MTDKNKDANNTQPEVPTVVCADYRKLFHNDIDINTFNDIVSSATPATAIISFLKERLESLEVLQTADGECFINDFQINILGKYYIRLLSYLHTHEFEKPHHYLFIADGLTETLVNQISIPLMKKEVTESQINDNFEEIASLCMKELDQRLKLLTTEYEINNAKHKIIGLIEMLKLNFFNNISLYVKTLTSQCRYKQRIVKKQIENPLKPQPLSQATSTSTDELMDEDKLDQINTEKEKEQVSEKPMKTETVEDPHTTNMRTEESKREDENLELYQMNEDEIVRILSYKSGKQVKMIKAVLENKLKNIVTSLDGRIQKAQESKEEANVPVDPKKKHSKK